MRAVSTVVTLLEATNDSLALIKAATHGVAKPWREQGTTPWRYSKAGLITTNLVALAESPRALIGWLDRERSVPLMAAPDACNARWALGGRVPRSRRRRDATRVEHEVRDAHAALHRAGVSFAGRVRVTSAATLRSDTR